MEQNLTFSDLGLSPQILQALEQKGYGYPTRIQAEAIPPFMQWKDVIAKAPTGTGKTFAFGIPMIEHIDPASEDLQGLILAPTRELAIPLGSLTGSPLLAGRGPLLHIKMQSVGSSSAHFENAFASAGINQTRHEIRLVVDVYVSVLLPGFSTVTKVTNRCAVAETVIVGSVPDTYTYFDTREDMSSTAEDFIMNNAG